MTLACVGDTTLSGPIPFHRCNLARTSRSSFSSDFTRSEDLRSRVSLEEDAAAFEDLVSLGILQLTH